jgi:DNA polymerase-3 subunit delta
VPKLDPRKVQKELEADRIWPVYWLHGPERMKARELLKRIQAAALGSPPQEKGLAPGSSVGLGGVGPQVFEGAETSVHELLDASQSLSLGGGIPFVVVRDAHLLREPDGLAPLLGEAQTRENLAFCCVFLSKDLDARRKFSKLLIEKAAVVACEEVPEDEREAWIGYLARTREVVLPPELSARLRGLDPWNLDSVDQELAKYALALLSDEGTAAEVLLGGGPGAGGSEAFVDSLLSRDRTRALRTVSHFAESPEEALPLLGLLGWNVRHLLVAALDRANGTRNLKLSPFLAQRFERWAKRWTPAEVVELQRALAELDFATKQTPKLPLALWTELVLRTAAGSPVSGNTRGHADS